MYVRSKSLLFFRFSGATPAFLTCTKSETIPYVFTFILKKVWRRFILCLICRQALEVGWVYQIPYVFHIFHDVSYYFYIHLIITFELRKMECSVPRKQGAFFGKM